MSNPVNTPASEQAKAIIGALLAGLTAFGTALADGTVSPVEIVGIAIAVLATYGTVFGVANRPTSFRDQRGQSNLVLLGLVVFVAVLLAIVVAQVVNVSIG